MGQKYWWLRYRYLGKENTLALGVYPALSLSELRAKRDAARKLIADGSDPSEVKRSTKALPDATQTFEAIARRCGVSAYCCQTLRTP